MPITTDVRAYWACEDLTDSTGNGHTASFIGTVTEVPAKVVNGWQTVNSNTRWVQVADSALLSPVADVFYIWGWMKMSDLSVPQVLVDKGQVTPGGQEYSAGFLPGPGGLTPRFNFYVSNSGSGSVSASLLANTFGAPSVDTFYFVEVWWDGVNIYIAVNRGTPDSTPWSAPIFDGTADLTLCRSTSSGQTVTVDEVGIRIGSIPTDEERDCLYNAGNGGTYPLFCGPGLSCVMPTTGGMRATVSPATQVVFEVYLAGEPNGSVFADGAYGSPTPIVINNPEVGKVYIVDVPVIDIAGFQQGVTGQAKIRRLGDAPNHYDGDVALSAIELYGKPAR